MTDALTFLYVEDDVLSREVMRMLIRASYPRATLTILPDSADFMARVAALPVLPSLFLLDVRVQPIDGFEMLRQLRAEPRFAGAKVLAVTASVMNAEVALLRTAGFSGAIAKPLDFDEFSGLIDRALAGEEVWYVT